MATLVHYLFVIATRLAPAIPPRLGYWLCDRVGDLNFALNAGLRANIMSNQRRVLGPTASTARLRETTRGVCRNLARNYFDQFRLWKIPDAALEEMVEIDGMEHVDGALAGGKGAILVTAHFGAPEVVSQVLAVRGYRVTVVVEHIQPEETFQLMTSLRASKGLELIPIDKPLIGLIRTLRKGGIVGLVGDRDVTETGTDMTFFGERTRIADGPVRLAQRTGAPIVVAYCRRLPDGRFAAVGRPPFHIDAEGEEAVAAGVRRVLDEIERFIRTAPEQWVMSVPLWPQEPVPQPLFEGTRN